MEHWASPSSAGSTVWPFQPEFAGKMNFYSSAVNDLLRRPDDQPSIGLILCKTRDRIVAALPDTLNADH